MRVMMKMMDLLGKKPSILLTINSKCCDNTVNNFIVEYAGYEQDIDLD